MLVFGAVIGGFLMEKGHLVVLLQPAELLIIAGAAAGTLLAANPIAHYQGHRRRVAGRSERLAFGKARYLNTLKMMYQFLNKVRKEGLLSVEMDVEKPQESSIFKNYPGVSRRPSRPRFCMRHAAHGHHRRRGAVRHGPDDGAGHGGAPPRSDAAVSALTTVADALPGLGIVAAVLGVVITMGALGGPPEEIGHKVAAALVGTFLGILLCYGVAGPAGRQYGEDRRRAQRISACAAGAAALLSERLGADDRHRDGTASDSGACAAQLRRDGKELQEPAPPGSRCSR